MQSQLIEKLGAYILVNNPDLAVQLQADFSFTQYLEEKVVAVMPLLESLLAESRPVYIIEELCLNAMTEELRPSRFQYIREVLEEEFSEVFSSLRSNGILTYEVINLIAACNELFETYHFSEDNEDNRFLRYAVIAEIHDYFF